jgi:hypothetical protein
MAHGEQVYEYPRSYAEQFGLMQRISLNTETLTSEARQL